MPDNDKDASKETVVETEEPKEPEIDLTETDDKTTDDGGIDKQRQQIQQEIGNKIRPMQEQIEELKELIRESNAPKKEGDTLDDEDYTTGGQTKTMIADSNQNLIDKIERLESRISQQQHKSDFQSEFPGVPYKKTLDAATKMAREENPNVADEHLAVTVGTLMRRMARVKTDKVETTEPKKASKKAPDSAKGAAVTGTSAPVSHETLEGDGFNTPEQNEAEYFSDPD